MTLTTSGEPALGVVGEKDTAVPLRRALEVAQLWMLTSGVATKADDPHSNTPLGNFAAWACFSEQRVSVRQDSQRDELHGDTSELTARRTYRSEAARRDGGAFAPHALASLGVTGCGVLEHVAVVQSRGGIVGLGRDHAGENHNGDDKLHVEQTKEVD